MKRLIVRPLLVLLLWLAPGVLWAQQGTETVAPLTVIVGVDHAPPYRILEPPRKTGLYLEIFEEIADRLGWTVQYREAPFRRLQLMLQKGEIDMMLGLVRTNEREQNLEFVAPAFPIAMAILVISRLGCLKARPTSGVLIRMKPWRKSPQRVMKISC